MKTTRKLGLILAVLVLVSLLVLPVLGDPVPGGSGNPHFYLEVVVGSEGTEFTEAGNTVHITITFAEYPGVVYNVVITNGQFVLNGMSLWSGELGQIHASGNATLVGDTWILDGTWTN